jgi:hypothetical protein
MFAVRNHSYAIYVLTIKYGYCLSRPNFALYTYLHVFYLRLGDLIRMTMSKVSTGYMPHQLRPIQFTARNALNI